MIKKNISLDPIDKERYAQQQEFLRRTAEEKAVLPSKEQFKTKPSKAKKPLTFEQNMDRTEQWLEETFPALFGPESQCKPLDIYILRDIKNHYKKYCIKDRYPTDLCIKAALYCYLESPEYLSCLQEGCVRYNINNEVAGTVTKEDAESAKKLLDDLGG